MDTIDRGLQLMVQSTQLTAEREKLQALLRAPLWRRLLWWPWLLDSKKQDQVLENRITDLNKTSK
jgi:hypothetical protein